MNLENRKKEVIRNNPLIDVVKQYGLTVTRNYKCVCPFHGDRNASMQINRSGRFYCYGCGAKGNVIDFVAQMDNISFQEAFMKLGGSYKKDDSESEEKFRKENKIRKFLKDLTNAHILENGPVTAVVQNEVYKDELFNKKKEIIIEKDPVLALSKDPEAFKEVLQNQILNASYKYMEYLNYFKETSENEKERKARLIRKHQDKLVSLWSYFLTDIEPLLEAEAA